MGALLVYSIKAGLLLMAMYLTYKWILAGENQHRYNRAVLMCIYGLSLVAYPLLDYYTATSNTAGTSGEFDFGDIISTGVAVTDTYENVLQQLATVLLWIYYAVIAICTAGSICTAIRLSGIIRNGQKTVYDGFTLVLTDKDNIAPFSWRKYIVMSRTDYDQAGELIAAHERQHIAHGHWMDLLTAQLIAIIMWYNPAAWLMREELKTVHEYQADEGVLSSGIDAKTYQRLLIKKAVGARFPSLANSLNHSKLKKRITMMYNQKSKRSRRLSAMALVPALAFGLYAANIPAFASAIGTLGNAEMTLEQADDKGTNKSIQQQANEGFTELDTQPEFPGGMEELYKFISANINYPENAPVKELGSVTVSFTVKADGSVATPKILVGDDEAFNNEALKLIGKMPKWKPGTRNGKAVDVIYGMPINFKRPKTNLKGSIVAVSDGNTTKDFIMLDETNIIRYDAEPTIYIDGVKADKEAMHKINPNDIESITIDKTSGSGKAIKITLKK